jgi:hypothetical protein
MSTAEMNSSRKHAYTDAGIPQLPEPTYTKRVRTLVFLCTIATLSTVSRKRSGYPFGSLMPYAIDGTGRPIFLISNMAMHTQNIQADHRASLFVGQGGDGDPLGTARATLVGDVLPISEDEVGEAPHFRRFLLLLQFPDAREMISVLVHPSDAHPELIPRVRPERPRRGL